MNKNINQTWEYAQDFSRHGDINSYLTGIIGKRFADYRKDWTNVYSFRCELNFPIFLVIETMFKCNLRCTMCIHSSPERDKSIYRYSGKMPLSLYEKIIAESVRHNCPSLTIGGMSEPLLDPDLFNMIKLAKDYGFIDVMINTNATLLDDNASQKLIESGLTRLRVGFDGISKGSYEKLRKGANFSKVKSNILNFIRRRDSVGLKLPVVRVSCVRMRENEKEINDFINFWKPIVDYVCIQSYRPHEFTEKRFNLNLKNGRSKESVIRKYTCNNPFDRLYIRGNGDVYACCLVAYGQKIGNAFRDDLYRIWNSPQEKFLRRALKSGDWQKIPKCKTCLSNCYI